MCATRFPGYMFRYFFTGTLFAVLLLALSCTSSQTPAPARTEQPSMPEPTRLELLTGGAAKTWRIVDYSRRGSNTDIDKCLLDNMYIFSMSGEFINDDGEVSCMPQENVRRLRGKWKFTSDSTRIVISGAGMSITARIAELSPSTLVLEELAERSGSVVSVSTFSAR